MKFFIDTGSLKEIKEAASWGILDGVTTNPSLVAKEGMDFKELILEVLKIVDGPVNMEVVGLQADEMCREGREFAKIHDNIVVKIPMIPEGMKATKRLTAEGIRINVTLCFSSPQALIAAKAGAAYISPFVGRLDDISHDGMGLIGEIVEIYDNYDYATEVLVASVRNPLHIIEAARMGADICTMPFKVMESLMKHPLTDIGLKKFLSDWESMKTPVKA
ncbi:MAG: fructose-6-phosphate aldolase [Acidobacteriota bacterium]